MCYGAATFAIVLSHKGVVGPCYGDIVGPAHDEAADEVGRVEVENAVVVGFYGLAGNLNRNRRVTFELEYLCTGVYVDKPYGSVGPLGQ